jgi:osmotically-inducible protein OsmY
MGSDRLREYEQMDMTRDEQQSSGREMTRSSGQSGQWQGYVVPYRYVGPGYRGWGYYSVMYQGPAGPETEGGRNVSSGPRQSGFSSYGASPYGESESGRYTGSQPSQAPYGAGQWRGEQWASEDRGQFYGHGPKGYRRSDQRIEEEVSENLMRAGQLDATEVEVKVRDAIVTLTGWVPDKWSKRTAEDIAESTMGVDDVDNQLQVESLSRSRPQGTTSATTGRTAQSTGRATTGTTRSSGGGGSTRSSGSTGSGSRTSRPSTTTRNGAGEATGTR